MSSGVFDLPELAGSILVADDDAGTRKFICATLRTEGYTVLEVEDGATALELLERHAVPVGVLVADYMMPGMTGRELAFAVRERQSDVKVLLVSGHIHEAPVQEGVMDGARRLDAQFLAKPFNGEALTRKLRALILAP